MSLSLATLVICWALSSAQSTIPRIIPRVEVQKKVTIKFLDDLPKNCTSLYQQGTTQPSITSIIQPWCSVRLDISQCIADNQQRMLQGNNLLQWSIGLLFEKRVFDEDTLELCSSLSTVAAELECLKGTSTCGSILSSSLPPIFRQYRNGTITRETAQRSICEAVHHHTNCWLSHYGNCSKTVKQFISNYFGIFFGKCASGSILDALPPILKDSAFLTCFIDSLSTIIEKMFMQADMRTLGVDSLMPYISLIPQLCQRTEEISQCIVQRSKNTTNDIDLIVLQFVNVSNINKALDLICGGGQAFLNASDCLSVIPQQGQYCGEVYYKNFFGSSNEVVTTFPVSATPSLDMYVDEYCPAMKKHIDCTSIPLSMCNPDLPSIMKNVFNMLLTDRCRTLADQPMTSVDLDPLASVFFKCGSILPTLIAKECTNRNCNSSITSNIDEYVQIGMDVSCRHAAWFTSCIEKKILPSNNILDRAVREMIDFSSNVNRTKVISEVCKNLPEIKANIGCILTQLYASLIPCLQGSLPAWQLFTNVTELAKMNGYLIRSKFCKPLQQLTSCVRTSFGSCSTKLDSLIESIPKALLRTDCGGVRVSTTNANNGVRPNRARQLFVETVTAFVIFILMQ